MKKVLTGLTLAAVTGILLVSCLKSENPGCPYQPLSVQVPQGELNALTTYLDTSDIEATLHPAGFYYNIITPGVSSDSLTLCTQVQIDYKGQLVTGDVFDQNSNVIFVLGSLIEGWRKGLPMLKKGGRMMLYVPPSLGYGGTPIKDNNGVVKIPANSILVFDLTLKDYRL